MQCVSVKKYSIKHAIKTACTNRLPEDGHLMFETHKKTPRIELTH
jgi:hypothetical protein